MGTRHKKGYGDSEYWTVRFLIVNIKNMGISVITQLKIGFK